MRHQVGHSPGDLFDGLQSANGAVFAKVTRASIRGFLSAMLIGPSCRDQGVRMGAALRGVQPEVKGQPAALLPAGRGIFETG